MKATQGRMGRVFVLRLEDGDVVPECIERFADEQGVAAGQCILIGGIGSGAVVVGPRRSDEMPPEPMVLPVDGTHEVAAVGVLAPDDEGTPRLHIHGALGRSGATLTGCFRHGVETWVVGEVVLYEILDVDLARLPDAETGFPLLRPGPGDRS
ncbi:MAG: PPC domain-containing DNA-binding protein [Planctomycetota bacterium]